MQLKNLQNKHSGKMAFVCGSGPSLHFTDTKILKNYITICVNASIAKFPSCDYFVADDQAVRHWNYFTEILPKSKCTKFLYKDKLEKYSSELKNTIFYSHKWWFSPSDNSYNLPEGLRLTREEPIIGARMATGSAVHIAHILDCNPIILCGVDIKFQNGKRYYWEYEGEEKLHRINGDKSFFINKKIGFDQNAFIKYWNHFYEANKSIIGTEVDIIDASDSALDVFPKMSMIEVIDKYGSRIK
jgi:hypothetical protein